MMKLKLSTLLLCLLIVVGCKKETTPNVVTFSGQLRNVNIDSVYVLLNNREKGFALDADGNFKDTIQLAHEGYFTFTEGRNEFPIYLIPGDNLVLNANYENLESSLKFSGKGEVRNNFIVSKENKIETMLSNEKVFYSKPANEYLQDVNKYYQAFLNDLDLIKNDVEASFYEAEKKNLYYEYLMNLFVYQDAYAYFNNQLPKLTPEFEKEIKNLDINNEKDYERLPIYRQLVSYVLDDHLKNQSINEVINKIKAQPIKDQFLQDLIQNIHQNSSDAALIYQAIVENTNNPKILEQAQLMKTKMDAAKNNAVANFSFPNSKNKIFNLSEHPNKLVYIDLWATWCRPCFMEFPHMKTLAEEYKGKDIVFLGISIDNEQNRAKWLQTIKEVNFNFEQVFAGEAAVASDPFLQQLTIQYIPRFVLIGKNGKLISSEAPTPSSTTIRKLINEHLDL
ncbi:TlpA family protein disulfide reductase [Vaginella massiliensis]|uniref:TlpA family protein disulfide reductase n=1 Tax=Vaginella massiliensis TaxID=1816680 RepID=UPI000B9B2C51|nr:TlpA disulfide reductase family protein [Vaginella massiliensis]